MSTFADRSGVTLAGTTPVASYRLARVYLFFQNNSDVDMWLNPMPGPALIGTGILVKANGGFYEARQEAASDADHTVIAVGSAAAKAFTCYEF